MAAYIDWASNEIIHILNWSIIARFSKKHDLDRKLTKLYESI